jgi:hypothetical protein
MNILLSTFRANYKINNRVLENCKTFPILFLKIHRGPTSIGNYNTIVTYFYGIQAPNYKINGDLQNRRIRRH